MIYIIYASTSGHTELVVEKVSTLLNDSGLENELHKAEITDFELINNNGTFIFATSTWEHGIINPYFDKILDQLKKSRGFHSKQAAIIGCGSVKYDMDYFCEGAKTLRQAWLNAEGQEITSPFYLDGLPYDKLDTQVTVWTNRLIEKLKNTIFSR